MSQRSVALIALALYAALGLFVVLHHEPWRDEADPWLVARDEGPGGMLRLSGYVGSPILWYLVLAPFAKLGLPYASLGLVHLAIATGSAAIVLLRAPFPLATRLALVFGYYLGCEYAIVARSYALTVLLLFAAAALWPARRERPAAAGALLGLAANTNPFGFFIAGAAAAAWASEEVRARRWRGPAIALAGTVAAFIQLIPPEDGQITAIVARFDPRAGLAAIPQALLPTLAPAGPALAVALAVVATAAVSLARRPLALFVLLASLAALEYVFVLKYPPSLRHAGMVLVAVVFAFWLGAEGEAEAPRARRLAVAALTACLAFSIVPAATFAVADVRRPFSGAADMAGYLRRSALEMGDRPIAGHPAANAMAVLPHLPGRRIWYPALRAWGTHMPWDRRYAEGIRMPNVEALARLQEEFPAGEWRRFLWLCAEPLEGAERLGYRLLHRTDPRPVAPDEVLFLYEQAPRSAPDKR